jgi:S-DNA-T family DNA segregation ATPase FtsK/SpoIIIE
VARQVKAAKKKKKAFLPEAVSAFLKRRLVEMGGLVLWILFAALMLSFISYHSGDPSLNVSTNELPRNWLGKPGADAASFFLTTMGLGAVLFILPLTGWGWRIVNHRGLPHIGMYAILLPVALLCLTTSLATLPAEYWPVGDKGFGGGMGYQLSKAIENLIAKGGIGLYPVIYGLPLAILGFAALGLSMGFEPDEWRVMGAGVKTATAATSRAVGQAASALWGLMGHLIGHRLTLPFPPRALKTRPDPKTIMLDDGTEIEAPKSMVERVIAVPKKVATGKRIEQEKQPMLDFASSDGFRLPTLDLLEKPKAPAKQDLVTKEALEQNARMLEAVLQDFGVQGEIVKVSPGPVVTLYELEPAPGTKSARVIGLAHDIARSMSSISARVAVVPGRNAIGIELPNSHRESVLLRELLASPEYEKASAALTIALGKDISGAAVMADLGTMPHLLVAGTTGSGKSVAMNVMILSLLYRLTPSQCRFIMIDPKMLELSVYDGIPHLLTPVVTDAKKAVVALKWAVKEMEDRYRAMSKLGVRNLAAYNKRLAEAEAKGEDLARRVQTGFNRETGEPIYEQEQLDLKPLPLIVVMVDEMADLMLVAGKDIEMAVQRLAQMARAAGIHLIMATQRPSVDVITGTIKANFPTRISFQVTSKIDSRTILGEQGAETLLGKGDMLYMAGGGRITRIHGPFVSDGEVEKVVDELKKQGIPEYLEEITEEPLEGFDGGMMSGGGSSSGADELYDNAVAIVARDGKASTSYIQRQLQIGYNRAANLIERMEREGVVSPANHVGKREVLVGDHSH